MYIIYINQLYVHNHKQAVNFSITPIKILVSTITFIPTWMIQIENYQYKFTTFIFFFFSFLLITFSPTQRKEKLHFTAPTLNMIIQIFHLTPTPKDVKKKQRNTKFL